MIRSVRFALVGGLLLLPVEVLACPAGETCNAMFGDGTLAAGGALTINKIGGKTIILGGNLTTTGAGAISLSFPGSAATYTFPATSQTLASIAGAEVFSNKSIDCNNNTCTNFPGGSGTPGGTNGGIQYNNSGAFGGVAITGLVKGNGTSAPTAAVAGTDYAAATSGSAILKGNGAGGFSNAASGTDYAPATSGGAVLKGNGSGGFSTAVDGTDFTLINAITCTGTDKMSAVTAAGVFTCSADSGSGSVIATDGTTTVNPATTISFDPVVFDVIDGGGGTAQVKQITTVRTIAGTTGTAIDTDANKTLRTTNAGAVTIDATAAATLGSGFGFYLECDGAAGCTFDPAGAETVDGASTLAVAAGGKAYIQTDGTGWRAGYLPPKNPLDGGNLTASTVTSAKLASKSGNGTAVVTTTGTQTSGRCVEIDANGNHVAASGACGTATSVASAFQTIGWVPGVDLAKAIVLGPVSTATTVTDIRGKLIVAEGSAATIMVRKAASTEDCTNAAGADAQTTATFDLNGTAPANQDLTLVTGAPNSLAAGDSLCLEVTGTTATTKGSLTVTYTVP